MTVVVTGAAGLIGRFVVKELIAAGEEVVSVDIVEPASLRTNERFERMDIGNAVHWFRLMSIYKPTSIIHLASMIAHSSHHDPIGALQANVMGTGYLFEAARLGHRPRIVYTSSVGVYGAAELYDRPVDENAPVAPGSIYGATKAACESIAAHYAQNYDLPSTGIRPTLAYGPGRYIGALGEINNMIRSAVLGKPVLWNQVFTSDMVHYPIHVTDIARVFVRAALGPVLPSPLYNVGGQEALSEEDMVKLLLAEAPQHGEFTKAEKPVEYLVSYKEVNCSLLYRETDFKPQLSFSDAVKWAEKYYTDSEFRASVDG